MHKAFSVDAVTGTFPDADFDEEALSPFSGEPYIEATSLQTNVTFEKTPTSRRRRTPKRWEGRTREPSHREEGT